MKPYTLLLVLLCFALQATAQQPEPADTLTADSVSADSVATARPQKHAKHQEIVSNSSSVVQVSKQKDDYFFTLPDSLLGRLFQTVTRFTQTPANLGKYGGEQVRECTVYFCLAPDGKHILLRSLQLLTYADTLDAISQAVRNSASDPIIGAFTIEDKSPKGAYKFKVNDLLLSDNCFALPQQYKTAIGAAGPLMGGATYIESIHAYPINIEVRTVRTYNLNQRSTPTASIGLNTSWVLLPEQPMRARIFDPRVGYFNDKYSLFADNQQAVEKLSFVCRWRLEPRDSADLQKMKQGELIEPRKPIVFYIDPATPKQWRPYLIQGVNDWNTAFEQAGWKNAIIAKEWPEDDPTMSLEDARFSVIRYLASSTANAYGPQVHDPRSGEIIESHIGWYHNVMTLLHAWYQIQCGAVDPQSRAAVFDEQLMGQLIRFVASHEVGHTLGLRHNFGSSSTVPTENLRDSAWVALHGHTPSIMDYARFNYVAQPEDSMTQNLLFPRINDYDRWAIQWGYMPILDATDAESDRWLLARITTDSIARNPRLWWGDGEGYRSDPRRQTEDLSDDAVLASEYGIQNLKRILPHLQEWNYWGNDTQDANLTQMFTQATAQFQRYLGHVYRYLGGTYYRIRTVDEPGPAFTPLPLDKSKAVIPFFDRHVFSSLDWLLNQPYISRLFMDKNDVAKAFGALYLTNLAGPSALSRLNSQYPPAEYLGDLTNTIFSEAQQNTVPNDYRQHLQSTLVNTLTSQFLSRKNNQADNVTAALLLTLQDLQTTIKTAAAATTDRTIRAHYTQLADQITRALDPGTAPQASSNSVTVTVERRQSEAEAFVDKVCAIAGNTFASDTELPAPPATGEWGCCNLGAY